MEARKGFRALAKNLMISPTKARRVANSVRNKTYTEAVAILENIPQKAARMIKKVVESAAANALYNNKQLDEGMLRVKELQVNEGSRYKRLWARGRGKHDILLKRLSHISVVVDEIKNKGE